MTDHGGAQKDLAWHARRIARGHAYQHQHTYQAPGREQDPNEEYDETFPAIPDLTRYRLNDTGNAQRFLALFGDDVRYSPERKEWLVWAGHGSNGVRRHWEFNGALALGLANIAMREFIYQATDTYDKEMLSFAIRSQNARQLRATLELARSFPRVAVSLRELDAHPYLLNCANGTIDLLTQTLHPHRREDLLTTLIEVEYDPVAECPRWLAFLRETVGADMVPYLQKVFGLCLSEDVSEKAFFLLHGPTDAGKTQMLNTIRDLLGPYAGLVIADTLTGGRSSNALADIAQLTGKRFVQASEIGKDSKLAQRITKYLVQGTGSEIKGALKYGNPSKLSETWKVFLDCNDLPDMEDPDDPAFIARAHPIHCPHTVPKEKQDKMLPEKLRVEFPGILAWLVRGSKRRQLEGLSKPEAVVADLARWRRQSNNVSHFLRDRCVASPEGCVAAHSLYETYEKWCLQSLKKSVSAPLFASRLARRGVRKERKKQGLFYLGLRLV
jgi:putative DNA primase/helicase